MVAVSDSGLEHTHCMFHDENVTVVVEKGTVFESDQHRKVMGLPPPLSAVATLWLLLLLELWILRRLDCGCVS